MFVLSQWNLYFLVSKARIILLFIWIHLSGYSYLFFLFCCRYGADVNAVTSFKDTPLHIATFYCFQNSALRLIQANAKLKCRNEQNGETPIDLARKRQLGIYKHMESISRTPPTLKSQCCSLIRQSLKPDVVTRVKKLSIPPDMEREILYPKFPILKEWKERKVKYGGMFCAKLGIPFPTWIWYHHR